MKTIDIAGTAGDSGGVTVRINSRPPELPGDRQRPSFRWEGGIAGGVKRRRGGAALAGHPFVYTLRIRHYPLLKS